MAQPIKDARDYPIDAQGLQTVLDVSDALQGLLQPLVVTRIIKGTYRFQVTEAGSDIQCLGFLAPLTPRLLQIKPEAQRAWTWMQLITTTDIALEVDDRAEIGNTPYRVLSMSDYSAYGFYEYHLVEDFTGDAGVTVPVQNFGRQVYFDGSMTTAAVDVADDIMDATTAAWTLYAPDNTVVEGLVAPVSATTVQITIDPAPEAGLYRLVGVA